MLYSTLALTLIFVLLWRLRGRSHPPGWVFALYLILTGAERFLVEFVRAKDDRLLWGLTTAQGIAALAIVGGLTLILLLARRREAGAALRTPLALGAGNRGARSGRSE